uniref:Uncharacterized protein n=1 Tax=Glossina pallidipes TaxID=7398 RepID=A0A1A9ZM67_GLOPL
MSLNKNVEDNMIKSRSRPPLHALKCKLWKWITFLAESAELTSLRIAGINIASYEVSAFLNVIHYELILREEMFLMKSKCRQLLTLLRATRFLVLVEGVEFFMNNSVELFSFVCLRELKQQNAKFSNQFYECPNGLQRVFGQCIRLNVGVGEELHDFIQHRLLGLPIDPAYLAAMEYGAQFRHSGEDFIAPKPKKFYETQITASDNPFR